MKRVIKQLLTKVVGKDSNEINFNINDYETISFDLFGTLIYRNSKTPSRIFEIVEQSFFAERERKRSFSIDRKKAEKIARKEQKGMELTLDEIYYKLEADFNYDKKDLDELKKIEIDTEIKCSTSIKPFAELLNQSVSLGKRVLIITDMYLPRNAIEKILDINGIGSISHLFISCEEQCTKRSGALFEKVMVLLDIKPRTMIHIGDDFISDYFIPRTKGINCFLYTNFDKRDE